MSTLELFLLMALVANAVVTAMLLHLLSAQARLIKCYMDLMASLATHSELQSKMTSDSGRLAAARSFFNSPAFGGPRAAEQEMKETAEKAEAAQSEAEPGGVRIQALF